MNTRSMQAVAMTSPAFRSRSKWVPAFRFAPAGMTLSVSEAR
jgi:hypothetical protein